MAQKLTGIVFNKQPYDDNSAIVTILSKELGKLAFLPLEYKKLHQKISMQYNS
ncbi:recombination protein O N-terminal domain-containing protein [Spiroplasma citri]|uniref:recombination protein O N-terminal domain-containing protein n=1 Tax=Spiroplasma citri TaxID=2133 RepID=UPI000909925C|nr:recombination protein O N-terminal domain-containing protein [Spiroplasma citri]APE74391.1 hypothetical protein SCITRI_00486 [Spiroplasma citri]WFG98849.1 recombination protein O N-terminal domain-containing protein [Spiroplasma citri]